jgi:hypothetical protein
MPARAVGHAALAVAAEVEVRDALLDEGFAERGKRGNGPAAAAWNRMGFASLGWE